MNDTLSNRKNRPEGDVMLFHFPTYKSINSRTSNKQSNPASFVLSQRVSFDAGSVTDTPLGFIEVPSRRPRVCRIYC